MGCISGPAYCVEATHGHPVTVRERHSEGASWAFLCDAATPAVHFAFIDKGLVVVTLLGDERAKPSHQPCAASQLKGPSCSRWPLDDGGVRARLGVVLARSFVIVTSLTQSTKCHSSEGSEVHAMRASEGRGNDMTFLRRNDMTFLPSFHAYRFACMRIRTRPLAVPSLPPSAYP